MKFFFTLVLFLTQGLTWAESSEAERAKKSFELTVSAGVDYRLSPTQLAAYYFMDKNNLLGLKAGVDRNGEERQTNFALQYKHFTGNSFYVAPEVFYLNTREDEAWFINDLFNIKKQYAEYVSMGVGVRIGNQWSWRHFSLGVDWIGYGRRVGIFRRDTETLSDNTWTLFNLYAGLSF